MEIVHSRFIYIVLLLHAPVNLATAKDFGIPMNTGTLDIAETTYDDDLLMLTNIALSTSLNDDNIHIKNQSYSFDYRILPEYKVYTFLTTPFFVFHSCARLVYESFIGTCCLEVLLSNHVRSAHACTWCNGFLSCLDQVNDSSSAFVGYRWTDISCKLLYLVKVFYIFSNWSLVSWTIEILTAVLFPMKINILCTRGNLKIVHFTSFVIICLVTIHLLTESYSESIPISGNQICRYTPFSYELY